MIRRAYPVELPPSVGSAAQRFADAGGLTLDPWVSIAVAQKIGSAEAAAEFFRRRAEGGDRQKFLEILRTAPDRLPDAGDELE